MWLMWFKCILIPCQRKKICFHCFQPQGPYRSSHSQCTIPGVFVEVSVWVLFLSGYDWEMSVYSQKWLAQKQQLVGLHGTCSCRWQFSDIGWEEVLQVRLKRIGRTCVSVRLWADSPVNSVVRTLASGLVLGHWRLYWLSSDGKGESERMAERMPVTQHFQHWFSEQRDDMDLAHITANHGGHWNETY